jgi:hypothetical protein
VYPMLPVSLDCPFSIAPSVFSNIYLALNNDHSLFRLGANPEKNHISCA